MRFVESYGEDGTVTIGAKTYPVPSLFEDEDGLRLLVVANAEVAVKTWAMASKGGVSGIVTHAEPYRYLSAEEFMEMRGEVRAPKAMYVVSISDWHPTTGIIPWRRMRLPSPTKTVHSGFVHLHAHSEYSPLDGLSTVKEMVNSAVDDSQPALGLTDHGVCAGHPELQKLTLKGGIKPIFGLEAYLVNERTARGVNKADYELGADQQGEEFEELKALLKEQHAQAVAESRDYYHLILWAMNDEGLQNLWAASTEAHRDGFYYHPRIDWATLEQFSAGLMCSTACLRGPIAYELLRDRSDVADANLGRLLNIFGDRQYLELGTCGLPEQHKVNEAMVEMAHTFSVPTVAVVDSHYPCYGDRQTHRVWIAAQTNKDIQDENALFEGDTDYHLMAEKEVRQYLHYLGDSAVDEAVGNTVAIANRCTARIKKLANAVPVFSKKGDTRAERIQDDVRRLTQWCMSNWQRKVGHRIKNDADFDRYAHRFEYEMSLLKDKEFCGYFLMVADYVKWAKDHGILVGPGRGSGGGCLVAFLCDITEIDPVEADLIFERFMTPGRTSLPDFDVDFPASKREVLTQYLFDKYGEDAVIRVGTHIRLKNKGVIRDLFRVLKPTLSDVFWPDIDKISAIIEEAESGEAGLGLKWDDLWTQHEEALEPFRQKYPEVFKYAEAMQGRLKSYGKHAAGVVISAEGPLTTRLPMRMAGDQLVAEFDMNALEELGLVKFDLLTLRTLDTIQLAFDMAREVDPKCPNIYEWTAEQYEDPAVWDPICAGDTVGIFQIETKAVTRLTKMFKPRSVADLADVGTLVRPGPMRSGLTNTYFKRRSGDEPVSVPDPRLTDVLSKTYGCIVYQEDVMSVCRILGGYTEDEADQVRKILGKKKVEQVEEEGRRFLERVVANGMEQGAAEALWQQMAEFAKYSFNRAHAFGYAVLGFWTAWLKMQYPQQFLIAALSTVDADRIPDFVNEARRQGYKVLPPDVNDSGRGFRIAPRAIRYGLDGIKGLGDKAVDAILEGQPYKSFEDFLERRGKKADMGVVKIMARVGCFDSLDPNRRALEHRVEVMMDGLTERCVHRDDTVVGPNALPCVFDWTSEPVVIGKSGRPLKQKPLPKRCSKSCRNHTPTGELAFMPVEPYTDAEVRDVEKELLGIYLSSTPFDRIPTEVLEDCKSADEIDIAPPGDYLIAATINKVRSHRDRNNKDMGFLGMYAQTGDIDVTCFKGEWAKHHKDFGLGQLCFALVNKNERGLTLRHFQAL